MSATLTNSYSLGASNSNSFRTTGFTGTAGRAFIVYVLEDAGNTVTGVSDNVGNTYALDITAMLGGVGMSVYRCNSITGAPTQIRVNSPSAVFCYVGVIEVSGLNASPVDFSGYLTDNTTTHALPYTTTVGNDFVICASRSSGNPGTVTASGAWSLITHTTPKTDLFYLSDSGSAGAKIATYATTSAASTGNLVVAYKIAKPAVTGVTSSSATEGGNIVHTVTLASATTGTTGYSGVLTGVTANTSTDLTSTLLTATYSNSVTFSAGNFSVPSGVSSWTVTLATTQDALDEANETFTLTVDDVEGTGTITDNDAPPVVTFSDGVESFGVVTCVATLGAVSGKDVSFQVDTANGTKTAGTNYTAIVAQTVTIPAGSLTAAITVNTL